MNTINLSKVTDIVQESIAEITNRKKADISLRLELRGYTLKFTKLGIRGLANALNHKFKAQELKLTPDIVQPSQIVEDLVELVWDKIPKFKKISS